MWMLSLDTTQDALTHHAANAAAVAIPVGAVVYDLPKTVTLVVGILGAIWYLILIGGWVYKQYTRWRSRRASNT